VPLLLATIWALSPFGSQAALRFTSVRQSSIPSLAKDPVLFIYPHATGTTASGDAGVLVNAANAILGTSLLTAGFNKKQTQDVFGNIKIPAIESIDNITAANGWVPVNATGDFIYASMLGMPFVIPGGSGNVTFDMTTWYWRLQNPNMTNFVYQSDKRSSFPLLPPYYPADNSSTFTNITDKNGMWQFGIPVKFNASTQASMPFIFEQSNWLGEIGKDLTRFSATLVPQAIDVSVACVRSACRATAVRNATVESNDRSMFNWTFFNNWFLNYLAKAFPIPHSGTAFPGVMERYIANPDSNPYGTEDYNISLALHDRVTAPQLAARLSQVLNTYWIAHAAGSNAAAGFNTTRYSAKMAAENNIRNNTATFHDTQDFFHVDKAWLAVLCLATIFILLAATLSGFVTWLRIGPDAIDTISALTRGDLRLRMEAGTTLDADERVRLLKDIELKIGDIYSEQEVGGISIGRSQDTVSLEKTRVYR
jgi:hypothetical protein